MLDDKVVLKDDIFRDFGANLLDKGIVGIPTRRRMFDFNNSYHLDLYNVYIVVT